MMSGRGRGRGRGSMPSGPRPAARDDEGNIVTIDPKLVEGPPPLYPEKDLPELPEQTELNELQLFVKKYNSINHNYRHSPFNPRKKGGGKPVAASNATLASVVTLDPQFFPSELYSEQLKSRGTSQAAQAAYWSRHRQQRQQADDADDLTLGRLDELAQKESRRGGGGLNTSSGGEALLTEEAEEGHEEAEADGFGDDEDFVGDEDDPYQQFDDDEGYEDPDDDEGGGEATYY